MHIAGFDFPDTLHYLVDHDMWAQREADGLVRVGITALGVALSGEIFMCRPKAVGTRIERLRGIAVAELSKAIVSIKSPLGGVIAERNPLLEEHPERIHAQPYGEGWLVRVAAHDWDADVARLTTGAAAASAIVAHAARMAPELKR